MWVGGCATALAAWASGPSALASRGPWGRRRRGTSGPTRSRVRLWGRRSVHRSAKMAPRSRFGAFVYTVGPWAWVVGGLGIAIVYTNGRIGPLGAGLGHLCTLLTVAPLRTGARTQECTQIGQNGPSEPFWGVRVHCCDASFTTRVAPGGTSAPTAMVCWRRPLGGRLPFDREDRLCVSGAAARLASSPRRQPTQTPEEPIHG